MNLPIYKIELATKLDEADKAEIKLMVKEQMEKHLEYRTEFLIENAEYLGDVLTDEKAEEIVKYDIVNDFNKIDGDYELISVNQEDEPEQYEFEKQLILDWAKN